MAKIKIALFALSQLEFFFRPRVTIVDVKMCLSASGARIEMEPVGRKRLLACVLIQDC